MQRKFTHKISGRGEGSGPKCLINYWSEFRLAQTEKSQAKVVAEAELLWGKKDQVWRVDMGG